MAEHKTNHCVYDMQFHIVLVTKYRKECITGALEAQLKEVMEEVLTRHGCTIQSMETDRDHIHLLVEIPPTVAPSELVRTVKTQTSRFIRRDQMDILSEYYKGKDFSLWADSYYIATTGGTTIEKIRQYIEGQKSEAHQKRRYKKRDQDYWDSRKRW